MPVRLSMVPVFVSDQVRALEFYGDKLGFRIVMNDSYAGYGVDELGLRWITVAPSSADVQLILYQPEMHPSDVDEIRSRVGQWTGMAFETEDVTSTYEEWSDRGVRFDGPPREQPWGGVETTFYDPDGNSFHLGSAL